MIVPARNLHLFLGFSMVMLNNQMVYFNMPCRNPEMIGSQDVIDYITIIYLMLSHIITLPLGFNHIWEA